MKRIRLGFALLVLAALATPADGQEVPVATFQAFEGRTDSYAVGLSTKQLSALPLPVEAFLTRTRTEVNSQPRAQAYAGIVDIPLGELLGIYGFPTKLPTYCYADYPGETEASCGLTGGPEGSPEAPAPRTGQGRGQVKGDGFNLDATAAESSVGIGRYSSEQLTVGASNSHSVSRIVDGALENTTEVILQQVDIKGAVAFEQLRATARAVTNGQPGGAKSEASLTVSGVSVGGERVPIPGELDLATLSKQVFGPLSEQLAAQGVTLTVLNPPTTETSPSGDTAVASVAGLRIESSEPATGNRVGITLGVARASAVAVPAQDPLAGDRTGGTGSDPIVSDPLVPDPVSAESPADDTTDPGPAELSFTADASDVGAGLTTGAPTSVSGGAAFRSGNTASGGGASYSAPGNTEAGASAPSASSPAGAAADAAGQAAPLPATLASEVIGRRVADRLNLAYGITAAAILVLGLLGFGLAHRGRA